MAYVAADETYVTLTYFLLCPHISVGLAGKQHGAAWF
jgi:hypothetical protein